MSREQAKGIIMAKTNAETKIANAGGTAVETGKTAARAAAGK